LRLRISQMEHPGSIEHYGEIWNMLSPAQRSLYLNDPLVFERRSAQAGDLEQLDVQSIRITGTTATVRALATIRQGTLTRQEIQEQHWLKDGWKWLFDGSRPINE